MSSEITLDLTTYKDRQGSRVDPGRYLVVVDDFELSQSKAGNQMVTLWLRVHGGKSDGSVILDRLVITEKALFRVVAFMGAIGLPTPRKKLRLNVQTWVGKVLEVDIDDGEPFNGRIKSEIQGYMRPTGLGEIAPAQDLMDVPAVPVVQPVAPVAPPVQPIQSLPPAQVPATTPAPAPSVIPAQQVDSDGVLSGIAESEPLGIPEEIDLDQLNLG